MKHAEAVEAARRAHPRAHLHPRAGEQTDDVLREGWDLISKQDGAENGKEEKVLSGVDQGQGSAL